MNAAPLVVPLSFCENVGLVASKAARYIKGYWALLDHSVSVWSHRYCNDHLAHVVERLFRSSPITIGSLLAPFPLSVAAFTAFSIFNTFVEPKPFLDETISYIHDGVGFYTMLHAVRNITTFASTFQNYYLAAALIWTAAASILFGKPVRNYLDPLHPCPTCEHIHEGSRSSI
jgi:hypothetical protein